MVFLPHIPAPVSLTAMAVALLLAGPAPQAAEPERQTGVARQADSPAEQDSPFFRLRRAVVEAAGIKDIRTKCLRSNNPNNVVAAAFQGLKSMRGPAEVARIRGKSVEEIVG